MQMFLRLLTLFTLSSLLTLSVFSNELELFGRDGQPHADYNNRIRTVKAGDEIKLREGLVVKTLDSGLPGRTSKVFKVTPVQGPFQGIFSLRLPLKSGVANTNTGATFQETIHAKVSGYYELMINSIPMAYIREYKINSYILIDFIPFTRTAADVLHDTNKYQPEMEALEKFFRKSALFKKIGSFRLEDIVYDQDKAAFVLLDWTNGHELIENFDSIESPTIVDQLFKESFTQGNASYIANLQKIKFAILAERQAILPVFKRREESAISRAYVVEFTNTKDFFEELRYPVPNPSREAREVAMDQVKNNLEEILGDTLDNRDVQDMIEIFKKDYSELEYVTLKIYSDKRTSTETKRMLIKNLEVFSPKGIWGYSCSTLLNLILKSR